MPPTRAIVFDLDGTLVDTLTDIADAMNHVLGQLGLPPRPRESYRALIGAGVSNLVRRAVDAPPEQDVGELVQAFRARYDAHLTDASRPYAGIPELLEQLSGRGLPLAVLSNKPDDMTRRIVEALFSQELFRCVRGHRPDTPRKPDPSSALEVAEALGVAPQACVLVGDSGVDVRTAKAAGMRPVGVSWGFRDRDELLAEGAERLLERPGELIDYLG